MYPLLMRGGAWMLGGRQQDYYFAGIVISWLAFAGAMTVLYRLALLISRGLRRCAVVYAAVFPFAYFFGMVYSESLFLLALVSTAYALRTRRWVMAAIAGAVMTATRVTGLMAVPGLAWAVWRASSRGSHERSKAAAAVVGMLAGIGAYSLFNYTLSGTPLAWYNAITYWGYRPVGTLGAIWGWCRRWPHDPISS